MMPKSEESFLECYYRERYEEAVIQIARLTREVDGVDAMRAEINDIQTMVGCDHVEGLARCVRERLEERKQPYE